MAYMTDGIRIFGDSTENSINNEYQIDGDRIRNIYGEIVLQYEGGIYIKDKWGNVVAEFMGDGSFIRDKNGKAFMVTGGTLDRMKMVQLYAHAKAM